MEVMPLVELVPALLAVAGCAAEGHAILCERRMQRHRLPGVSYWEATLRWDGGWRRSDLFSPTGLDLQKRAARSAFAGLILWSLAAVSWLLLLWARRS